MKRKFMCLFLILSLFLGLGFPRNAYAETLKNSHSKTVIDVFKEIIPSNYKSYTDLKIGVSKIVDDNYSVFQTEETLSKYSKSEIVNFICSKIQDFNSKNISSSQIKATSSNHTTTSYWWGVSHRFYTHQAAEDYAHELVTAANLNAGAAVLAGAVFGGVGAIPNGLTAAYCYQLAEDVRYNNNIYSRISVDISYVLVYSIYEF